MKKATWLRTLVTIVLTIIIALMIFVFTKGWPLMYPPKMEDIEKVIILESEAGIEKEFTDAESIGLAVKMVNFLNYIPFSSGSDRYEPLITIIYVFKDDKEIHVSANNTEVFQNGKGHQLRDPETFFNLANGVFMGN